MNRQLLFLGDSLIEFFNWQKRFPNEQVYSFGSAGETAEGLLLRLPKIFCRIKSPDLVMIMTGTNNIAMEDYGFLLTYDKIIIQLQDNYQQAAIVMSSLLPMELYFLGDAVPRVNKKLTAIARHRKVVFLDLYPKFLGENSRPINDLYEADGVHLSPKGYETWARALEDTVFRSLGQ